MFKNQIRKIAFASLALFALTGTTAAVAQVKERTIKFASVNPKGHPIAQGVDKFVELVAAKSGGKITVKSFPGAVLGGDLQTVSALQGGTVEMFVLNSGNLVAQHKEFAVYDLPFLFASPKEADAVVDGPFGSKMHSLLEERGLIGVAYWELGFRNLTNSKRPITKVEDIAGLKVRVVQTPIYIEMFNALGANATPMPFPEVFSALEQKAIDGQENPLSVISANKFADVQKHLALTRHTYNPQSVLVSKKYWDTLSAEEKKIITDAAKEAAVYQRQISRNAESGYLEELKKAGMQVTEFAPGELQRLRDKVKPVIEKQSATIGAETVQSVYAELAKLRAK